MVRLALVAAAVAIAVPAHAAELPGVMGMYPTQGGPPLAMLDSTIDVRVRGPIAEATVTQTFRNGTDRATEATYIFPLPPDAAVSAMAITVGARTIRAAIETRDQAQQRYERAVAAGLGAGLLDQERPDVFTQTVSAIPARGTVTVTLRFDTLARYAGGRWELVVPLVVAPRFVPGVATGRPTTGTGRAPDTNRAPDASRVTPGGAPAAGGRTELRLELADGVADVASPTHELVAAGRGYALVDPHSDHDVVVRWRAKLPAAGWVEAADDGGGYAAVVVEAPPAAARNAALRVMVVLDRAATTRGDASAVQRPLVRALLGALGDRDRAAVTGSDTLDWQAPEQLLRALDERWGRPAGAFDLTKLLAQTRAGTAALVLVSDGLVADDRAAIAAAAKLGGPIHVIGIGPAPNRSLLAAIAHATGGTLRFATAGDDLAALARDVLADAASPPAPLTVTWGTLAARDVVPGELPRLGAGQAALVVARVARVQAANARVRGDVFGFVTVTPARPPLGATTSRGPLARRWARMKLDELIARGDAQVIAAHAREHGLVSPHTSMVAIGDEVIVEGGVKRSVAVPVSVPAGMRWQEVKRQITVDTTVSVGGERAAGDAHPGRKKVGIADPAGAAQGAPPRDEDDDHDDHDEMPEPARDSPVSRTSVAYGEPAADYADDDAELVLAREGLRRALRISAALGGGLAVRGGEGGAVAALSARLELGYRALFGLEGSLWLVGGDHLQGAVLGSFALRGLGRGPVMRRLELGLGAGLRVTGEAAGPALGASLRVRLPVRPLAAYLRYDGALLVRDAGAEGQNAGTFGVEASW
jgi:Ca-activated chloride channel homolog